MMDIVDLRRKVFEQAQDIRDLLAVKTENERLRALVGEDKIALDRHNSEIRSELVAVLAENRRLRAQVAALTETIQAAQQALNAAPAWHQGIRDAIDVMNKIEE